MNRLASLFLLAGLALGASAAYHVETIVLPPEVRGGISGVAFTPKGTLVLATRYGEIWMRESDAAPWRKFAGGLDEPLGLLAESEAVVYVAHKPELLKLADTDGDGRAETFDVLGYDWGQSNNYHEFFYGLRRDAAGNFYGAISLDSSGAKEPAGRTRGVRNITPAVEASYHGSEMPWRGWAVKITPAGETIHFASGLRQPNGVGLSPAGELFMTDNQGDYKPSCGLMHLEFNDFHGHAESLKWEPGFVSGSLTPEKLWQRYKAPAVVFPHGPLGVSAGEPIWDLSEGRFGPFAGQTFVGDFTNLVIRVELQKVGGAYQGVAFPFLGRSEDPDFASGDRLKQGGIRMTFAPDGSLYLGLTSGWGAGVIGLQKVTWDGAVPAEVLSLQLTERGFALKFTQPMDRATVQALTRQGVRAFRYYYQVQYGSPPIDETTRPISEVQVAADGLSAELTVPGLQAGFVYEFDFEKLRTQQGKSLANPVAFYTANRLLTGEVAIGGTTRLPRPNEEALGAKAALNELAPEALIAEGKKVYALFCAACHQPDGRGIKGGAANFVDDKSRLAKSDQELLKAIAQGLEMKGMPAFGSTLPKGQQKAVLAYLRAAFGEAAAPATPPRQD
jgi:mono/diheme cytochrome c family protein